jgi:membrane associated rhomboid family serine protease
MIPRPEINFQRMPVTLLIAAVAVALELTCLLRPELREYYQTDLKLGMLSTIWDGEVWRPLTSSLLHVGILHVAFNVYWLVTFGAVLEPFFGSFRYLGLLVLLAYVSAMPDFLVANLHTPLNGQVGGVGLSGVGYGLFGLIWVGRRRRADFAYVCNDDTVRLFVLWFFFCIAVTYLDLMRIGNVAHGAGLLFGVLYGLAIFDRRRRVAWIVTATAATLLVLATLFAAPGHPLYEQHKRLQEQRQMWQAGLALATPAAYPLNRWRSGGSGHGARCRPPRIARPGSPRSTASPACRRGPIAGSAARS